MSSVGQESALRPACTSPDRRAIDRHSLARRAALVYSLMALAICVLSFYLRLRTGAFGYDFRGSLWQAGRDILAGHSPYPPASASELVQRGNAFVYPPLAALVSLPLAPLPQMVAAIIWSVVNVAALAAALRLVGCRDWRCFVLCLASLPFLGTMFLGQLNGLLALAIAAAWHYRRRAWICGAVIGAAIALKLLIWPLFAWLLFSRRFKGALVCLVATTTLLLGSWAVIGFDGLGTYPHLLRADADAFQNRSYSIVSMALHAGLSETVGRLAALLALLGLLAIVWRETKATTGYELFPFAAALLAGVVASPVLHEHYLILLFVPLAAARPTAGWRWLLPLGFWISPVEDRMHLWQIVSVLVLAGLLVLSLRGGPAGAGRSAPRYHGRETKRPNRPSVAT